jgi:eukaryotic-like serine/threonine-protein kinase
MISRALVGFLALAGGVIAPASSRSDHATTLDRIRIPAGPFIQGSIHGEEDERPARTNVLPDFSIDRTEVTRAAYARCVAARRCRAIAGQGVAGPDAAESTAAARLPMVNVSWLESQAFCRFAGGRLPTESEWEKAARGTDGREYPWGNQVQCERANWGNFDGEGPCGDRNPGHPVAVGGYPQGASPYGVLDLGGNVWEWVADRYDDDASSIVPEAPATRRGRPSAAERVASAERTARNGRPAGGAGVATAERRVVRGGSCCSYFVGPRAANRNAWAADHRDFDLGFRCAANR